jgi:glycosyltransferase involved in cell wall biosynthesis
VSSGSFVNSGGPARDAPDRFAVVVPAVNESATIGATVSACLGIAGVDTVVVVDDGSRDDTIARALSAGATVLRHSRNHGKATAMRSGAERVALLDTERPAPSGRPRGLLFVDADLADSAGNTAVLIEPVREGTADATVAVLPVQDRPGGGHGFVVRLARKGILDTTGWSPTQPLSGMRCLTREAFEAAMPLAHGWGVETAMTIDLITSGFRLVEVPCELRHRVTGSDWRGQVHRARQFRDVARALLIRRVRRAAPLRLLARLPHPRR